MAFRASKRALGLSAYHPRHTPRLFHGRYPANSREIFSATRVKISEFHWGGGGEEWVFADNVSSSHEFSFVHTSSPIPCTPHSFALEFAALSRALAHPWIG